LFKIFGKEINARRTYAGVQCMHDRLLVIRKSEYNVKSHSDKTEKYKLKT